MKEVSSVFKKGALNCYAMDAGMWYLKLMNTEGKFFDFKGSSTCLVYPAFDELSELIRVQLKRNDLFLFNGNPNYIIRMEINYRRVSKIKGQKEAVSKNTERIVIDRASQTMKFIKKSNLGINFSNTYYIPDEIPELLDSIPTDGLFKPAEDPPDVLYDTDEIKEYTLSIFRKHGKMHTISGTYDKNGLPVDWEKFIERIYDFMLSYGFGELFDKTIYGKAKRRESDLIFCKVTFEDGGQTYTYIADSDDYYEGDLVVVPAGQDNHEAVVRIESIEYRQAEEAPFPLEKTKHILRKFEDEDEDC